jgi:hypothetical protein
MVHIIDQQGIGHSRDFLLPPLSSPWRCPIMLGGAAFPATSGPHNDFVQPVLIVTRHCLGEVGAGTVEAIINIGGAIAPFRYDVSVGEEKNLIDTHLNFLSFLVYYMTIII